MAHLYNLRRAAGYQRARGTVPRKTHSVQRPIGARRAPQPNGLPGFIRVDSVHQGDLDGIKGVYLINAVTPSPSSSSSLPSSASASTTCYPC